MNVAIIGSGAMGAGIAQIAAAAGNKVLVYDKLAASVRRCSKQIQRVLEQKKKKGALTQTEVNIILSKLTYTSILEDVSDSEIIIESITENLDAKQQLFRELESVVADDCILGTNTSSLSVTSIAAACRKKPERVLGIHFFIPATQIKLVEIIPALQSDHKVVEKADAIIKQWNKSTVKVKDVPGFLVNRISRPYYLEALRILEEGVADIATIDWAMTSLGRFRMGPFTLMDYIGNDINYTFTRRLFRNTFNDQRYQPSITQRRLVEAGYLGRKTGKGFYHYQDHATNPAPNKDEYLGRYILLRILVLLINESANALFHQFASRDDIDLAMTTGIRFPNGLLAWADDLGIAFVVKKLDELYAVYKEDRYRCSPLLRKMKKKGERFY